MSGRNEKGRKAKDNSSARHRVAESTDRQTAQNPTGGPQDSTTQQQSNITPRTSGTDVSRQGNVDRSHTLLPHRSAQSQPFGQASSSAGVSNVGYQIRQDPPRQRQDPPRPRQDLSRQPLLDAVIQEFDVSLVDWEFLRLPRGDFEACMKCCAKQSTVVRLDPDELRRITLKLIQVGLNEEAKAVVERSVMLKHCANKKLDREGLILWLAWLLKNNKTLDAEVQDAIDGLERPSDRDDPLGLGRDMVRSEDDNGGARQRRVSIAQQRPVPPTQQIHPPTGLQRHASTARQKSTSTAQAVPTLTSRAKRQSRPRIVSTTDEVVRNDQILKTMKPDDQDKLKSDYIIREGKKAVDFFVKGRVLSMLWHENAGHRVGQNHPPVSRDYDRPIHAYATARGEVIYSHIRRFVIVKVCDGFVLAIPIFTYQRKGVTKKGMREREQLSHAIIYTKGLKPIPLPGEPRFVKPAIQVTPAPGERSLDPTSRLHFGRITTINMNIKMKDCGQVDDPKHLGELIRNAMAQFATGGEQYNRKVRKEERVEERSKEGDDDDDDDDDDEEEDEDDDDDDDDEDDSDD